ncbi:DUF998 domain-containing protein [Mycetocola tolaasinivorans]|uniref:DUF998 domain-containing protein n=1 Tax=Mycetocola tolaasinivorans TaxID=76635 RepID=A0A3L6ZYV3_9MICO|nr:DUF998 domain-containing protein [Mycetocola tolaasinivorans]RLP73213.1 DUF998 domain-containing protein [Mycetocola tolaasinivorans]
MTDALSGDTAVSRTLTDSRARSHVRSRLAPTLGALGALCAILALVGIWVIRLRFAAPAYVSELGGDGAPDAGWFAVALGTVALAGVLLGTADVLRAREARRLAPSGILGGALLLGGLCLIVAGSAFLVATVYPCTAGCPVPGSELHTARDTVHITAAISGFALVAIAMLIQAVSGVDRRSRVIAWASAAGVAVIAGVGGLLALAHVATNVGAWCELIATSIAILWCASRGFARRTPEP